jgi:hypothetical protein
MKLLIMKFSPLPFTSSLLGQHILLGTLTLTFLLTHPISLYAFFLSSHTLSYSSFLAATFNPLVLTAAPEFIYI